VSRHDEQFGRDLHRLLMKVSEVSDKLPSSLFIEGVVRVAERPSCGGRYSDVYRANYEDGEVALKVLRSYVQGENKEKTHRVWLC
jgi:hypothetical protein